MANILGLDSAIKLYKSLREFLSRKDVEATLANQFVELRRASDVPVHVLDVFVLELVQNIAIADGKLTQNEIDLAEIITGFRFRDEVLQKIHTTFACSKRVPIAVILVCCADYKYHNKIKGLRIVDEIYELARFTTFATSWADNNPAITETWKSNELLKTTCEFIEEYKKKRDNNLPIDWAKISRENFYRN